LLLYTRLDRRIIRAFLIEEQKIVKAVLRTRKQQQAKTDKEAEEKAAKQAKATGKGAKAAAPAKKA